MLKNKIITPILAVSLFAGGAAGTAALASAQTSTTSDTTQTTDTRPMGPRAGGVHHGMKDRGVNGTVSAVSGNTITVTNADGTSYTVDASNAKVSKVVELTVADIKVGDTVGVMGTVSGTSVTAQHIMDGMLPKPAHAPGSKNQAQ